ncbi:MAG: zinc-ribbon domain-containing protein [Pseudomonadota bacterium]
MILECTQCASRYLVPDTAIGAEGRTVRCANCRHSWFQPPALLDLSASARVDVAPAPHPGPVPRTAAPEPEPEPAPAPRIAMPVSEQPVAARPAAVRTFIDDAVVQPDYDAFAHRPMFKPRRNPAKRWTAAALVAGLSMTLGAGAILYSGAPGIAAQLGLPIGDADTPLLFSDEAINRRDMGTGNELFAVSGKIVNPTGTVQRVPDIRVELKDAQNRVVYNWTVTPRARTLNPGGTIEFNSGRVDVPASSKQLRLTFAKGIEE